MFIFTKSVVTLTALSNFSIFVIKLSLIPGLPDKCNDFKAIDFLSARANFDKAKSINLVLFKSNKTSEGFYFMNKHMSLTISLFTGVNVNF